MNGNFSIKKLSNPKNSTTFIWKTSKFGCIKWSCFSHFHTLTWSNENLKFHFRVNFTKSRCSCSGNICILIQFLCNSFAWWTCELYCPVFTMVLMMWAIQKNTLWLWYFIITASDSWDMCKWWSTTDLYLMNCEGQQIPGFWRYSATQNCLSNRSRNFIMRTFYFSRLRTVGSRPGFGTQPEERG